MDVLIPKGFEAQYQTHLQRLQLAGFRPKTIEAYSQGVRRAGKYFEYRIDALNEAQLTQYFSDLLKTHSWSTLKHDLYGLKFYYAKVLHQDWPAPDLVKAPHSQRLPDIVTVEQMQQIISTTKVLSYRVFFYVLYTLGLRLGEGLRLQVGDIDADRLRVQIRDAKGNRDRFVPLPVSTLNALRQFWAVHRHPSLLFPNRAGGLKKAHLAASHLDAGGVQKALRAVCAACGLKKEFHPIACVTAMPPIA
ncbi:MAG: site-specific integrase [Undibacterium sp.]|nr:site-specific integrase [Undibacterium sp.]